MLSQILRHGHEDVRKFVTPLFQAASELNDPAATFFLVSQAIKTGRLDHTDLRHPLVHHKELVRANNRPALILEGKILEIKKKSKEALLLYERAVSIKSTIIEMFEDQTAIAWGNIARVKNAIADKEGARYAIEQCAFQCDDPQA